MQSYLLVKQENYSNGQCDKIYSQPKYWHKCYGDRVGEIATWVQWGWIAALCWILRLVSQEEVRAWSYKYDHKISFLKSHLYIQQTQ